MGADDHPPKHWGELSGLHKLLEHRVRLGLCVLLSRHDTMNFTRLRFLLKETDGSLGAHLRKLEDGDFIKVNKMFADRKPVSWYRLTSSGRKKLSTHIAALEHLIKGNI